MKSSPPLSPFYIIIGNISLSSLFRALFEVRMALDQPGCKPFGIIPGHEPFKIFPYERFKKFRNS